jgi:hypothetical protein
MTFSTVIYCYFFWKEWMKSRNVRIILVENKTRILTCIYGFYMQIYGCCYDKSSSAVHMGFVVDKVALGRAFPQVLRFYPLSISFHGCSITRKNEKN